MNPTIQELYSFLESINSDFNPPLTNKVNFFDFIKKITEKAVLITQKSDNKIVGLTVLYCNNVKERKAYISLVGVLKEYRGLGIAKNMLNKAITYAQKQNFTVLGIHSNNPIAILLYQSLGFCIIENGNRVYMEKKLIDNE